MGSFARPERVGSGNRRLPLRVLIAGACAVLAGLLVAAFASASHVEPVPGPDNPQASDCPAGTIGWKYEPVNAGTVGDGTLSVTITKNDTSAGETFDFTSNLPIATVLVKGGPVGNEYVYNPPVTADTGLHAPVNPANDRYYGLSHLVFCYSAKGTIVVEKQTNPDGDPQPFDFTSSFAGAFSLSDGQTKTTSDLDAGTYSVSESALAGWDLTSATCSDGSSPGSIGLSAGETVTCAFVNTKQPPEPGRIIVEKQSEPDDHGDFEFATSYGPNFTLSDGQENDSGPLAPGTYSVSELEQPWWFLDSVVCSDGSEPDAIGLTAGETVRCVFTNFKKSDITVVKQTDPDGDQTEFSFESDFAGSFELADGQSENSGPLLPGTYSVSENTPEGWALTSATCDNGDDPDEIELGPDEDVTCTFVNTKRQPQPGIIVVEKQTDPDGDPTQFEFTFGQATFSLGDDGQEVLDDLEAGTYTVSESTPEGWDLTSATCDNGDAPSEIELGAGDVVTCVFTNTKRGTIVVEKQTSPDGAAGSFVFTGDAAGSIGDGGQIVVSNLVPGTYGSTESAAEGWILTAVECDDANSSGSVGERTATFQLEAGETVTCTFRNSQVVLGQGSIDVQKSASPTSLKEPGGPVTYSVRITNTSNVDLTISNVVDDRFGDLDDSGGNGCFDVPINMGPGDFATCQFVGQVMGPAGTVHVNTVTATGNDEFGNPVSDADDARVDITPLLIDLVIVKEASSPTPLNGTVDYALTVTNKGPDTATNVQLADPAPAGITYLSATPSQGTCSVAATLVTCSLGTIVPGQVVTVGVTARATAVGTHVNTATVTGSGGAETNPADNVDSAQTVVPAPLTPPVQPTKPTKPKVRADVCLSLVVTPKMITADGKPDRVVATVRAAKKPMRGKKVLVRGVGIRKTGVTNRKGVAVITINPRRTGLITITTVDRQKTCAARRIGVVGVFLPPVTG